MRWTILGLVAALCGSSIGAAQAADVQRDPTSDDTITIITVRGPIEDGDAAKLDLASAGVEKAVVAFDSPGGNLIAGLEIGQRIKNRHFATAVEDGRVCASACALAWLAGQPRLAGYKARIGFHAAFVKGQQQPSGSANALVGAYLNSLGLRPSAIVYFTNEGPMSMQWFSFEDAKRVGVEVASLPPDDRTDQTMGRNQSPSPTQTPATTGPALSPPSSASRTPRSWAEYGDWIQIHSRANRADAEPLAQAARRQFGAAYVFRFANGWYAVLLGPYAPGAGRTTLADLIRSGAIPDDSRLADTSKMVEVVSGGTPLPRSTLTGGSPSRPPDDNGDLAETARSFFLQYLIDWSNSSALGMARIASAYADSLVYYGQTRAKDDVLQEKRTFADRWPLRDYHAVPNTLRASCSASLNECVVLATIEWRTQSPVRSASSTGTAQYEFRLRMRSGAPVIIGESGTVLSRNLTRQSP